MSNCFFTVWVPPCTENGKCPEGCNPFGSGFPIGASSIPVGTRFSAGKSSVLYLCSRLMSERGWLRHLLCGQISAGRPFLATVGQADFVRTRTKYGFAHRAKSDWPEKGVKVYISPRPAAASRSNTTTAAPARDCPEPTPRLTLPGFR